MWRKGRKEECELDAFSSFSRLFFFFFLFLSILTSTVQNFKVTSRASLDNDPHFLPLLFALRAFSGERNSLLPLCSLSSNADDAH